MNILYIAPYKDNTGYAHAAINTILSMDAVKLNVACRPLKLNNVAGEIPPRILELEKNDFRRYDCVITHSLPHHLSYVKDCGKNVCYYCWETSQFKMSSWPEYLSMMDETWVTCYDMVEASRKSGVNVPALIVPYALDIVKYQVSYKPLKQLKEALAGDFAFYVIGEWNRRKNFNALLRAFHTEFDPTEPVRLVIKTSKPGADQAKLNAEINHFCENVKHAIKLYPQTDLYKKELVITDRWDDLTVTRMHATCDCYVATSYGEAWNYGCFEAMAMGKPIIASACGGHVEYLNQDNSWLIPVRNEQCFAMVDTFQDLYSGRETWGAIDITLLRKAMREAYESDILRKSKSEAALDRGYDFTYEKVGNKIKEILN